MFKRSSLPPDIQEKIGAVIDAARRYGQASNRTLGESPARLRELTDATVALESAVTKLTHDNNRSQTRMTETERGTVKRLWLASQDAYARFDDDTEDWTEFSNAIDAVGSLLNRNPEERLKEK